MVKVVGAGRLTVGLSVFRDPCRPTVRASLSGTVVTVDAVDSGAGIPSSRSLKYSESLREELNSCRSSTLLLTSAQGQS